jgi:hypothetical protein
MNTTEKAPYRTTVWTVRTADKHGRTFRTSKETHHFETLEARDAFTAQAPADARVTAFGIDYDTLHGKNYRTDRTDRPALAEVTR